MANATADPRLSDGRHPYDTARGYWKQNTSFDYRIGQIAGNAGSADGIARRSAAACPSVMHAKFSKFESRILSAV